MIGRLVQAAGSMFVYFCVATLISQAVIGGYLWFAWQPSRDAFVQMLAVAQGVDLLAIRREDEDFVIVDIADNGCGIPEEELTKIWLTFHTSKAKKGGTGLGLPACLQIMERMRGRISVVSEVGIGSTFTLHVPVYRPGADEEA